ncbi:flagellar biosynthesis protein FlhB [Undibacter mobilis]|uniref:Flagellar biosynthetic protein FlhB n=1 Tax=Undibacter mobilis TaxID=2292256 RepID=A0A371BC95_9BRAD|nr:flagellar biosynthesis protein FlhB [Undibacter mobilis]RDV05206.1 flagellar biosynthesis protein FlhB [Undibacter mobilis]
MADEADLEDKTEDPSQKRLDDAFEKGNVVKSQEVNTWFIIAGATLVLMTFSGNMVQGLTTMMRGLIANAAIISMDGPALPRLFGKIGGELLAVLAIPFLVLMLAALAGNIVQHRFVWSTESLTPKFSKISPLAGMKRLFSKQSLANFLKGLIKIVILGAVMVALLWPDRDRMEGLVTMDPAALLPFTSAISLKIMGAVVALLAVVAAADYLFQYRSWYGKLKMSLQELKDEYKQTQGDPFIKGKLKQIRQMRSKQRMSTAVPKASVIITNPTHYAVALQYERGMEAPLCVAKGVDAMALQIRKIATEHNVPIVENVPLARALHATVEVDQAIPPEHYKAVAEVIGYVMKLRRAIRS